jgi:hypothetical protein
MKTKYFLSILMLVTILSCKKIDESLDTSAMPVVEAYLTPGKLITLKVAQTADNTSDSIKNAENITGLQIKIKTDSDSFYLKEISEGTYQSDSSITVLPGRTYDMEFDYKGKTISSETSVPTEPADFSISSTSIKAFTFDRSSMPPGQMPEMPDPLKVKWTNADGKYYMVVVECIESDPTPINSDDVPDMPFFRNKPDNVGSEYDIQSMSFKYYGKHLVILCKLNAEYAGLYNENGTSSQNIGSPYSNIENGLGIFTAFNADTMAITVTK